MQLTVRPATASDVASASVRFRDLLADRWRPADDRRSFVAVDEGGRILGHCRGIDNDLHPGSRVLVLETVPEFHRAEIEDALLRVQIESSSAHLDLKIMGDQPERIALARRHHGVVVQAMPPWRYVVGPELRAWADSHRRDADAMPQPITSEEHQAITDLESRHYVAQHASWAPSAPAEVMREALADPHDSRASRLLRRDGRIVAAALLWPQDDGSAWTADPSVAADGQEVSLLAEPYDGPRSVADRAACLASLVDACPDGLHLLIDCHMSLAHERALRRSLPPIPGGPESWTAMVEIPVPGAPAPIPMDPAVLPEDAAWIRDLCAVA